MNFFLDTSAVVKLYHEELGTENLVKFLEVHSDKLFITISDLTKIEFHSTFLRRVRSDEIGLSTANEIFKYFDADIEMFYVIKVDDIVKKFSIQLLDITACKKSLRTLDAIQLSAAIVSHQVLPVDYFISSDKELLNVSNEYFSIFNPEDRS